MSEYTIPFMLITGLLLGFSAGFIMHRADYCIAGMFRDLFLFRSVLKLRTLVLLVVSSMVLFELARQFGLLPIYPFRIGSPSLANVIGGFLFGIGMVLAGGCVVGSLYKMGAGSMLSAVAFVGLIAGSGLYAEFHPWWKSVITATTVFKGKATIPQILDIDPLPLILAVTVIASFYFHRWYRQGVWVRSTFTTGSLQPWQAALFLSLIGLISYITIGTPLAVTTAYSKFAAYLEAILFNSHFQTLAYFKADSLSYRQPITAMQLSGGPGPRLDAYALIQYPVIAGIVLGGTISATMLKEFRLYVKLPWRQYLSAAIGGVVMGVASRMAPSCNVWHLLGGLPILAVQSLLFLAGLLPGTWFGSRFLSRFVIR